MLDLPETLSIRGFRLEAAYTAQRLRASEDARSLAPGFEEAADKFALLEAEEARLDVQRVEAQASVESADDAWDDVMRGLQQRLLELSGHNQDHELYRRYFSDIPSQVTSLSYPAEILISKDLERALLEQDIEDLRVFAERLREKREPLENMMLERTRLEVETARFQNRVALAKSILNRLRRMAWANLEEIALARHQPRAWCARFFQGRSSVAVLSEESSLEHALEPPMNGETTGLPEALPLA